MKKYLAWFLVLMVILTGCVPSGIGRTEKFKKPDIKNDYCGVVLNFQYCKCAFHNQYCDAIGMKKSEANKYVNGEYQKWLQAQLEVFGAACTNNGGIARGEECQYCKDGYSVSDNACVKADAVVAVDGPFNPDCTINQAEYDRDWKKYSDIDEVIPFEERSYEAKQALTTYEQMIEKMVAGFALERDAEIETQMRAELQAYKTALVNNIKTNLLKSFWRMSWVTYSTIKGGKSLGESYSNLLTVGTDIETLGSGLKVIQGIIPSDSSLAINTDEFSGKVKSVGVNAALEAVDSLGDPVKIATELFNSASGAALPSAELTEEEIGILRDQHVAKGLVDTLMAEIDARTAARETQMAQLETEIAELQAEIAAWEQKEKDRVAQELIESCKELKPD